MEEAYGRALHLFACGAFGRWLGEAEQEALEPALASEEAWSAFLRGEERAAARTAAASRSSCNYNTHKAAFEAAPPTVERTSACAPTSSAPSRSSSAPSKRDSARHRIATLAG